MGAAKDTEQEVEQYGAAVGIAISNPLQKEALAMAFTRGGGITVRENLTGTSLPNRTDLDANAAGGSEATVLFNHTENHNLQGLTFYANDGQGNAVVDHAGENVTAVSVDKDGDGKFDTKLSYERDSELKAIKVDQDNDGKIDAVLSPDVVDGKVKGLNVDLEADGTVDAYAEFVRNQNDEVKSIRFRKK